ncbi:MAG: AAA family ATPase [Patescibacteria group bacterium]|nr:AAA family ATPase [Patescibacteria group bacterium]
MFIKAIKVSNYRSLKQDDYIVDFAIPNGKPGSGLTVIVGPNNVGKSNLFHAMDFVFNKSGTDNIKHKQRLDDSCVVQLEMQDDDIDSSIDEYVQDNKKATFKSLVYDKDNRPSFSIQRIADTKAQSIEIWHEKEAKFKNVSGIDAPLDAWLTFLPLWANTSTEEVASYSAKSIINKLLGKIVEEIQNDEDYKELHKQFDKIFGGGNKSVLGSKTLTISDEVSSLIHDQFADVGIKFQAEPPKIDQYIKQIKTMVHDGDETEITDKGNGLQRAIMIALIQVYAKSLNKGKAKKPFFLFIDEPELYLNPQSQKILLRSLRKIAANEQVFIVTHSPYFIDWADYNSGAKVGRAKKLSDSTVINCLDPSTDYSSLISGDVKDWQKPYILDVAAKELLFAEKVLFLEGQEDVGLIRKWLLETDKDIKFDLFGYGVGGFGNYAAYLRLAKDLGLLKVAAIYDNGAAETLKMAGDANIQSDYMLCQLDANDIRDKYRPCNSCTKCTAGRYKECGSKIQYKSGCFDESGMTKSASSEYKDFCSKFENIVTFMES